MSLPVLLRAYRAHPARFVAACVLAALAFRLVFAPYGAPLNLDAFAYLTKAREIVRGEWTPVRTHAIGWSIVLAPAMWLTDGRSIETRMAIARVIAGAIGALGIIPLFAIARRTVDDETTVVALVLSVSALQLVHVAVRGMSEPLHALLLLVAVAAALDAPRRTGAAVLAGAAAGLACAVHPTGLLVPVIATAIVLTSPGPRLRTVAVVIAVAGLVAAPAAWQRQRDFGSPVAYGENNRIFAASPGDLWNPDVPVPTAADFFATHDAAATARWLVVDGLGAELADFALKSLTVPLVPFAIVGLWLAARHRRTRPLAIAVGVFLAGWIVPYPVLGASRHLAPVLPLALVIAALGLTRLAAQGRGMQTIAAVALLCIVAGHGVAAAVEQYQLRHDETIGGREWGAWIAAHVRGRVGMVEGQEMVMLPLGDAAIGGADISTMYAPATGLALLRPGPFPSLDAALAWLRRAGATHLVVDYLNLSPAYLDGLRSSPPAFLHELYSSVGRSNWPVRVYQIDWTRQAR